MVVKQLHILETYYGHSLLSLVLLFQVSQMPLDNEDVQAIAQALQALLPAAPAAATPPATISSVSIKLPPFWTTRPEVWFCQVEAQFATCTPAITVDLTKFNHVVTALAHITAGEVEALILSPPANGKYDALKVPSSMPLTRIKLLRTWSFCPCRVSVIESLPAFSTTWSPSMLIPRPSFTSSSLPSCLWKHVASSLGHPQLTSMI